MKRLAMIVTLGLLAGTCFATFELQDPAAETYEEQQPAAESEPESAVGRGPLCTVDAEINRCWCFDRDSGEQLTMTQEECWEHAAKPATGGEPQD